MLVCYQIVKHYKANQKPEESKTGKKDKDSKKAKKDEGDKKESDKKDGDVDKKEDETDKKEEEAEKKEPEVAGAKPDAAPEEELHPLMNPGLKKIGISHKGHKKCDNII